VSRRINETIQLGFGLAQLVVIIPIHVRLVPGRAGVFRALREQLERWNSRTMFVDYAVLRGWIGRIATGIGRRWFVVRWQSGSRIELRQAVEGSIAITVICPVLAQFAEVVIERAILLRHEDDVIELRESKWKIRLQRLSRGAEGAATENETSGLTDGKLQNPNPRHGALDGPPGVGRCLPSPHKHTTEAKHLWESMVAMADACTLAAIEQGIEINIFFFTDGRYRPERRNSNGRKNAPVQRCKLHPESGLTVNGGCWLVYQQTVERADRFP
jgi:hypothetical protein